MKTRVTTVLAGLVLACAAGLAPGAAGAAAAPTAEFDFAPLAPLRHEPVSFTFRGTCDAPPCTVTWRWFQPGGSTLGTAMGTGTTLSYAFPAAGSYQVVARITNALPTHGSASATHTVTVRDTVEDSERRVRYGSWRGILSPAASGGGYRSASGPDATASWSFTGPEVTYLARTGPTRGIASLTVDGSDERQVDLYSPTAGTLSVPLSGLSDAAHRLVVRATGTRNPASTGTVVTVDGLAAGPTVLDDPASEIGYDSWTGHPAALASGGTVRRTSVAGASTACAFTGTTITWLSAQGPRQGRAGVFVDGTRIATVDGYAARSAWQVPHTFSGLADGPHVLRITALGTRHPDSGGTRVTSDAFVVR